MTDIATQVSQRYEDLFRVGDNVIEALVTKVAGNICQFLCACRFG